MKIQCHKQLHLTCCYAKSLEYEANGCKKFKQRKMRRKKSSPNILHSRKLKFTTWKRDGSGQGYICSHCAPLFRQYQKYSQTNNPALVQKNATHKATHYNMQNSFVLRQKLLSINLAKWRPIQQLNQLLCIFGLNNPILICLLCAQCIWSL